MTAPSGTGDITGAAFPGSTVELFASHDADGEGEVFLGNTTAGGAGDYALTVTSLPHPYLTATATDNTDGTSEFSAVFTAPIPVLDTSTKTVDRATVSPGEVLTYTLTLVNTGTAAATAQVTDTLPAEVTWANSYSVSAGTLTWEAGENRLHWSGTVNVGTPVIIVYQVTVNAGLSNGEIISNAATVNAGAGITFDIRAPDVTVVAHYLYLPLILR